MPQVPCWSIVLRLGLLYSRICVRSQPELVAALPSDNERCRLQKRTINTVGVALTFADQSHSLRRHPDNEKLFTRFHLDA